MKLARQSILNKLAATYFVTSQLSVKNASPLWGVRSSVSLSWLVPSIDFVLLFAFLTLNDFTSESVFLYDRCYFSHHFMTGSITLG